MRRVAVLALLTVLLTALGGALSVALGWSSLPIVPGVILCAYAAMVDPPIEGVVTAAAVGLVVDAMTGTSLGLNVLAFVAVLVSSRFVVGWVTSPRGVPAALFVGGFSAAHAFLSLLLLFLFQRRGGFGLLSVFTVAIANALVSVVLIPPLQALLVALKLEERGETLQERLAGKGRS
ncbi:MAG: hypothetical protein A2138_20210 [Deltaproteobacteria bacterium RBG_16_71_12]|nr:MAG: hypothetical protein A2138_20210 [Deltaproteobacteria bacterium RBG_16_71_12]